MDNKKLGFGLLAVTGVCWIVTTIGMIIGGSHRWTEPVQQLGWMFFVTGFLVLYLQTGREIRAPPPRKPCVVGRSCRHRALPGCLDTERRL